MKKFPRFIGWLPYNSSVFIAAKTAMLDANNRFDCTKRGSHCSLFNSAIVNKRLQMYVIEKDNIRSHSIVPLKITAYKVSIPMPLGKRKLYTSSAIMELDGSIILRKYWGGKHL